MDEIGKILVIHACDECYYCKVVSHALAAAQKHGCYYSAAGRYIDNISTMPGWCPLSDEVELAEPTEQNEIPPLSLLLNTLDFMKDAAYEKLEKHEKIAKGSRKDRNLKF